MPSHGWFIIVLPCFTHMILSNITYNVYIYIYIIIYIYLLIVDICAYSTHRCLIISANVRKNNAKK